MSGGVAAAGLAALLALATLGEGGARPTALVAWHGALVVLLLVALLKPAGDRPRRALLAGPALTLTLLAVVVVAAALRAADGFAAWLTLLEFGAFLAVTRLAASGGPALASRCAPALLALASAQGTLALWQRLVLGAERPAGTLLNPNHLGAWLAAALVLGWGELGGDGARRRAALLVPLGLPAAAGIVVSGSRGALLGLATGAAALAAMRWPALPRRSRIALGLVGLAVLAAGALVQARRLHEDDPFRWQRARIWRASLDVVEESPWTGAGLNQFATLARRHQFDDRNGPLRYDRVFTTTHSDPLRAACELGIPGAGATLLILLALGATAWRRVRLDAGAASGAATAAALAALAAQAAVDNLSERPAVYLLAGLLVGSLAAGEERRSRMPGALARIALSGVLVGVFAVGDLAPWLAWREVHGLPRGRLDADESARLDRALALNPWHPDYRLRLAEHVAGAPELGLDEYAAARDDAEAAVRLDPLASEFALGVARVEAQGCLRLFLDRGTRERARRWYERAEAEDPFNPFIPLERSEFLLRAGDAVGAVAAAERALAIEPRAAVPRLRLAAALLLAGGPASAGRAAVLVDQAEAAATRWSSWVARGDYPRRLLAVDAGELAGLRRAIAAAAGRPADDPPPPRGSAG